jgi:hypothetical protein
MQVVVKAAHGHRLTGIPNQQAVAAMETAATAAVVVLVCEAIAAILKVVRVQ